jgi:segregation and condensation protein A
LSSVKDVSPAPDEVLNQVVAPHDAFRIALPNFEGPLDLLLHLIREHKVDILDIPIALIAEKYLAHLARMRSIDLDIAGEFLVMASTLLHLKSRMLLPREERVAAGPGPELASEPLDPRAELVRRLLEYQKYRCAAEQLGTNDILDRNVFPRRVVTAEVPIAAEEIGLQEVSIYKLIEALDRVLQNLVPRAQHEVVRERMSLSQAMLRIAEALAANEAAGSIEFADLFDVLRTRAQVVITFIALLEMTKRRYVRVFQAEAAGAILIASCGAALQALVLGERLTPQLEELDREYR